MRIFIAFLTKCYPVTHSQNCDICFQNTQNSDLNRILHMYQPK